VVAKVFLSHASEDRVLACEVHGWLVEAGHEVFLDQDLRDGIALGEEWEQRLHERLRWANAVVCVVTSAYLKSTWCAIEVGIARSRGSQLLPLCAEPGVAHPLLKSVQHTDYTADPPTARAEMIKALHRVDAIWPDDRCPFPGLRPFEVDQHRVFFGRTEETKELAELLRSPAEHAKGAALLVVGPSGCGKSSLARAGLLPVMADVPGWWTLPPIVPGADPVAVLVRELATAARQLGLDWTVAQVRQQLGTGRLTELADELLLAAPGGRRRLLIVVDQFEELLTQTAPIERARFAELLGPALDGPVQLVATLRSEFLDQLLADPGLATLPTQVYPLRPLRREALRSVIEKPARLAGIDVDDSLVDRLVNDTDSGEALPLLAFTLAQLADGISRGGRLSSTRYDKLGGVQSALTDQANAALADAIAAGGRSCEQVIAGLLRLVTVDEQGRPTRWRVPRNHLPEPVARELDIFVGRRLLTTDTDHGSPVVGVTHEAFLSAWELLAQAIQDNVSALRTRRAVEYAATEWNTQGRPPDRLWERGQLAAAVADTDARIQGDGLVTDRVELSPTARVFLRASIRRDRYRRGRATTFLSVLLVLAVVAAGIAFIQQRAAEQQRDVAVSRQAAGQALGLRATNPALAAQLGLAGYRLAPTVEARSSLLSMSADPYATLLTGHTGDVSAMAFSPKGHTVATGSDDGTARLWDVNDPHHPSVLATLTANGGAVTSVTFSPDGHTVVTGSPANTARLWDVSDLHHPSALATLTGHTNIVISVAFSPDGHTVMTGSYDNTARLWDVSDLHHPSALATLTGHTNYVYSVAFSPDAHTVATASDDDTARLWDVSDPHHPSALATLTGHTDHVLSVAFSPDGRTLASGSADRTARLWDVSDPHHPSALATLTGHTDHVFPVAFSPDGRTLASGSADRTARLWDVSDPHHPSALATLTGHSNTVFAVAFSADGQTLATASADHTARLWDLPGPIVTGHTGYVYSVAFSPDRRTLATASDDDTARLWDVSDPHHPNALAILTGHTSTVYEVAFSPDGRTLATASGDQTVRLWDISDPHHPSALATLTGHTGYVYSVAFSPDGRTLATGSFDNTARLWDVSDLHHPNALALLTGHTLYVYWVAFAPDGRTLATASADQTVRLWDVSDRGQVRLLGQPLTSHTGAVEGVTFSPDGRTLATASLDSTARLWDVSDLHHPSALATLTGHTNGVYSVVFSSDGHTLATGSLDSTARLWDVSDLHHPSALATLTGHTNDVYSTAFSPDGQTLVTGSADHTARLWEPNVDRAAVRICKNTAAITKKEWDQYLPGLAYQPPCP
jgi:WD40 repeat protein